MNLYLHGSIYGYKTSLASPSTATGKISFDFANLPIPTRQTRKRTVVFGNTDNTRSIEISVDNNTTFTSNAVYAFNFENSQYQIIISRSDGSIFTQPSSSSNITVDLFDFVQESVETTEFKLPNYSYNSYYTYSFDVEESYVSRVEVYVKNPEESTYIQYDVENVKYLIDGTTEAVFFTRKTDTTYEIDFGSGVHGKWIPGADIKVIIYKTLGESGNFAKNIKCTIKNPEQAIIYDEMINGDVVSTVIDTTSYFTVTFESADGGSDPISGETLRKDLINYIQTRDNFVSERDFYNIIEKYTTDFRLLNKKTRMQENIIYVLRALRDEYQTPLKSMNIMKEIFVTDTDITNVQYDGLSSGYLNAGQYYYKILAFDSLGTVTSTDDMAVTILGEDNVHSVRFSWDPLPSAVKYRVYLRNQSFDYYHETTDHYFTDNGRNDNLTRRTEVIPTSDFKQIVFPEIEYEGKDYICPFMLRFSDVYNMYEGYLFYPEMYINFSNIVQESTESQINSIHPSIFLNIIYSDKKSSIQLKSYQDLAGWSFKITIPELQIESLDMTYKDTNTYEYVYTGDNQGVLPESIIISILCYYNGKLIFTAKTAEITQAYYYSDQLQFPVYTLNNVSYIIDLPIVEKDKFLNDKNLYLDKIYDFLRGFNFEENRMISDNIGFRFLNTVGLYSFMALNSFKQGGNILKGYKWFNKYIPYSISTEPTKVPVNNSSWIIGAGFSIPILGTNIISDASGLYGSGDVYGALQITGSDVTTMPYAIIVSGDYREDIRSMDVVRIKNSTTGLNGAYRVITTSYDLNTDRTSIVTFEKLPVTSGDGELFVAEYEPWKAGGPDNIAVWNGSTKSWLFHDVTPGTIITVNDNSISTTLIYTDNYEYVKYSLLFPLKMSLVLDIDRDVVVRNNIDLDLARDQIKLEVAKYLQLFLSGTDVSYYSSSIIDFILETRRNWIKHIKVTVTDAEGKELNDGLETNPENVIQEKLSSSKLDMLNYTSIYVYWDVDNIKITYLT